MWRAVSPRGASPEIVARCNDRHRRFALETAAALTRAADRSAVQMLDGGPIPFGLLAVDASRLRYANAGFLDAFGLDAQGLAAFEPASMFADTAVWKKVAEAIVAGGAPEQIETDITLARGRKAHMRLTFARGSYNGGAGIAIWLIDLSQRRALELELVAAREAAEEAARAKAGFLAAMSHDLRTPLNAIIGFGELITRIASDTAKGPAQLAKIADYATSVTHSGELLRTLVENVLEAARLESGKLELAHERLNVAGTLGLALETLAMAASQKGVSLAADLAPDVEIEADARALTQIALNLIGNAIKYTDAGGAVRVRLTRGDAGAAVLEIADNGRGIGAEDLARVIKPFERGEREAGTPRDGVGLGLAIAKGLVEAQDGTLDIASTPGKGTTIVVRLP
jgi:signal transduction histidine kinase